MTSKMQIFGRPTKFLQKTSESANEGKGGSYVVGVLLSSSLRTSIIKNHVCFFFLFLSSFSLRLSSVTRGITTAVARDHAISVIAKPLLLLPLSLLLWRQKSFLTLSKVKMIAPGDQLQYIDNLHAKVASFPNLHDGSILGEAKGERKFGSISLL